MWRALAGKVRRMDPGPRRWVSGAHGNALAGGRESLVKVLCSGSVLLHWEGAIRVRTQLGVPSS